MANEQLPPDAYGPINKDRPGNIDPFANFDNYIRYQDMLRYQTISQYAQSTITPQSMSGFQKRDMAMGEYQYGVYNDQSARYYQRQREMDRSGRIGGITNASVTLGAGLMSFAPVPLLPALAIGAAAMVPAALISGGVDRSIERQRMMHEMALDLEQYRSKLGFDSGMSYKEATGLSSRLLGSMGYGKNEGPAQGTGNFFDREQQMRIHKIAISNNMVNAKGYGADAGTMKQYEKNFDELKKTTEDVVKLLQTTIEGGLSVIKNLQNTGFRSMKDIRSQVAQAKAFGNITGLGAENMMMVGAAGAQAVQGTPWGASVGANMYQQGATQASIMAGMNPGLNYSVERVGGVAAAGGALARFNMNIASSGMGTKAVAYAMNPDGSINQDRLGMLTSQKAGAFGIISGAARLGYAMGPNRVLFEKYKMDWLNNPNVKGWERDAVTQDIFKSWGSQRRGDIKAKAWVFAGLGTNDIREQALVSDWLLGPKGYAQMNARSDVEDMLSSYKTSPSSLYGLKGFVKNITRKAEEWGDIKSLGATRAVGAIYDVATKDWERTWEDKALTWTGKVLGVVNPNARSVFGRPDIGDMRTGLNIMRGIEAPADLAIGINEIFRKSGGSKLYGSTSKINDVGINIGKMTSEQLRQVVTQASSALFNNKTSNLLDVTSFVQGIGGIGSDAYKAIAKDNRSGAAGVVQGISHQAMAAEINYKYSMTEYNLVNKNLNTQELAVRESQLRDDRRYYSATGRFRENISDIDKKLIKSTDDYLKTKDLRGFTADAFSGVTKEDVLDSAGKGLFWREKALQRDSFTGQLPIRQKVSKRWSEEGTRDARRIIPGFDPSKPEMVEDYIYKMSDIIEAANTQSRLLTTDERTALQSIRGGEGFIKQQKQALSRVAASMSKPFLRKQATLITDVLMKQDPSRVVSDSFTQGLGRIFTNEMDPKEYKTFVNDKNNLSLLAAATGSPDTTLRGLDMLGLTQKVTQSPAFGMAFATKEKERRSVLMKGLQQLIISGDAGGLKGLSLKINDIDNYSANLSELKKDNRAKAMYDMLQQQDMAESASMVTGDQGASRQIGINPPITNYWNNRWVM